MADFELILITDNPTTGYSLNNRPSRARVLSDDELKLIWQATEAPGHHNSIVRLLILTGQRKTEIASLQKDFLKDTEITLPSWLTKNGREHTFPIGELTKSVLKSLKPTTDGAFLFPARGGSGKSFNGWSKSKASLDQVSGVTDWTLHDLRRTFATKLAAVGTPLHITERLLNHISGSHGGIVGVYQRHSFMPEMKAAIDAYDQRLENLLNS